MCHHIILASRQPTKMSYEKTLRIWKYCGQPYNFLQEAVMSAGTTIHVWWDIIHMFSALDLLNKLILVSWYLDKCCTLFICNKKLLIFLYKLIFCFKQGELKLITNIYWLKLLHWCTAMPSQPVGQLTKHCTKRCLEFQK